MCTNRKVLEKKERYYQWKTNNLDALPNKIWQAIHLKINKPLK